MWHFSQSYKHFPNAASLPAWLEWGFWVSPLAFAKIGASINEVHAPRWQKVMQNYDFSLIEIRLL
jgi:hypothetical protein